jgi:hypothetical protein
VRLIICRFFLPEIYPHDIIRALHIERFAVFRRNDIVWRGQYVLQRDPGNIIENSLKGITSAIISQFRRIREKNAPILSCPESEIQMTPRLTMHLLQ